MDPQELPRRLRGTRPAQRFELVVAVSENDVIGRGNALPWRLPADLRHFKALTLGKPVLMGRKTHESIGKPLPGRTNLVLTRDAHYAAAGCKAVSTVEEACLAVAADAVIMVIGGAEIYRLCTPLAHRIHLTLVHAPIADGDAFFTAWHDAGWREVHRERHVENAADQFAHSFITLERTRAGAGEVRD